MYNEYGDACIIIINNLNTAINVPAGDDIPVKSIADDDQISPSIYPNPNAGEEFMLRLTGLSNARNLALVSIYDMLGKQVFNRAYPVKGNEIIMRILPTQTLESGMYTVLVLVDEQTSEAKLIIE